MTPEELIESIETIAVVTMENRSFDHVLGHLSTPEYGGRDDIDGIKNKDDPNYINPNTDGFGCAPFFAGDIAFGTDLPHTASSIAVQLARAGVDGPFMMNGFVRAYESVYEGVADASPPMMLQRPSGVPVTTALAKQYLVCDRWFASVPSYTTPNRLMALSGECPPQTHEPLIPSVPTVYEWLSKIGVRWRVYSGGLPFVSLMPSMWREILLTPNFRRLHSLEDDLAHDAPGNAPQVLFLEPEYYDSPVHAIDPCDNHAPLSMAPGEAFLARVYRALTADPKRWAKTLLILSYDEHGGFFDHVPPLPVRYHYQDGQNVVDFASTGPRVPAILIGPCVPKAGVCHTPFDNTAILQLLADRFASGVAYSPAVAERARQGIGKLAQVLVSDAKNVQVAALPAAPAAGAVAHVVTGEVQDAFKQAAHGLLNEDREAAYAKYPELARLA